VQVVKIAVFALGGVLTGELLVFGLIVGLFMIPGAWAAKWLMKHMPLSVHAALIDAVIILGAATFLWQAVRG